MRMFVLKYFRVRQKAKHLSKLLTSWACGLPLFGVLVLTLHKSLGFFPLSSYILSPRHEETFLLELWFTVTSFLSQDPFLVRSVPFTICVWLLCFRLSSFHIPWSSLTSLAVLPAPPWFSSHHPTSGLSCTFLLALLLVRPLACCTPACSRASATVSVLLASSPLFISFCLAFHCLSRDVPLWVAYWWYEPSPSPPSQTPFLNPSMFFASPIPFGHTVSSSSVSASCSSHASRLRAQSLATNFWGNLTQSLRAQTFAGCNYLLLSSLRPSCWLTWCRHACTHAYIYSIPIPPGLFSLCNHQITCAGSLLSLPLGTPPSAAPGSA